MHGMHHPLATAPVFQQIWPSPLTRTPVAPVYARTPNGPMAQVQDHSQENFSIVFGAMGGEVPESAHGRPRRPRMGRAGRACMGW